ncbi:hypothetical protein FHW96_002328 [Novosphingobium sp. SG751A]|uniref:GPO family capsid scaffolding protein n=1 Tax=Novosphingobium sp. SG751A TaxID=2587000 RepID=UPI001556E6B2|nr:GPO family capsid scaffolding protein [Novosphingobium sp. SG751A]NOW46170.1 hypothetical protein [Novosphingobium sp. SG751A]
MKTKPFLLATAGSTVDGRVIDDKMIEEMASSYNPKTYGARLNIEHIRGISGQAPFKAYGDVDSLSVGEVEVDFNGTMEKRKALYGVFDITADAKALNEANQKVYSSIEIEPNFGGKGFAYLMGCALTDSPAAIATERLQFNRNRPGTINLSRDEVTALELADDGGITDGGKGLLASMSAMFDKFTASFAPAPKSEDKPQTPPEGQQPATFDFSTFRPMFEEFSKSIATSIDGLRSEFRAEADALAVKLKKLEDTQEGTPAHNYTFRPPANGTSQTAKTDC